MQGRFRSAITLALSVGLASLGRCVATSWAVDEYCPAGIVAMILATVSSTSLEMFTPSALATAMHSTTISRIALFTAVPPR